MAITQPGGAGTIIYVYDDSDATNHAAAPGPHTFAEISTFAPTNFIDNGTSEKSYRSTVDVQIGDAGTGTATTTLTDTSSTAIWDAGKTLKYRTPTTNWVTNLGTKVGTGDRASGRLGTKFVGGLTAGTETISGKKNFYGAVLRVARSLAMSPADLDGSELVNCLIDSTLATGNAIALGTATSKWSNLYNLDITAATNGGVIVQWGAGTAERITIGAPAPTAFISTSAVGLTIKDLAMFGSPTTSDMRWTATSLNWTLVRPLFSGNAPKFSSSSATLPGPGAGATHECWLWDVKVVDRNGAGILGIPVTLTDSGSVAQVDTTTGSDGSLTYGSGLTTSAVIVADHYISGGVYTIGHKSPFDVKINMPSQAGYNSNYQSKHYKFYWPGYETYTTSSGSFEDISDIVPLQEQAGNPTTWVECEMP